MSPNLQKSYSDSSSTTSSSSDEDDYISMEVDDHHHACIFNQSSSSEFEFQQSFSKSSERDPHATTSPADELFYMGKLLPLHLPPRLEMAHKILQNSGTFGSLEVENFDRDEAFATPVLTPTATTPFQSCNVSPSREYVEEKKSWMKKMKMMTKQSSNSSSSSSSSKNKSKWTSYIKSLFTKSSGCADQHSAAADHSQIPKENQQSSIKNSSAPSGLIKYSKNCTSVDEQRGRHRRSFSAAIKHMSITKSLSNSLPAASVPANNFNLVVFKRSISSNMESENPIQAAIAHCKRSHNLRQNSLRKY